MRIPLIIRAPGGRPRNVVNPDPASGIDVSDAMRLALAAQARRGTWHIARRTLGRREHDPERTIFASQGTPGKDRALMMRTPQFKLTRYDDGGGELYDLSKDPDELENLIDSAAYALVRERLT